ncbi:MAG: hypothetical protein SNJ75_09770 [Gemmataceae bacterium]
MIMPDALSLVTFGVGILTLGVGWLLVTQTRWGRTVAAQLGLSCAAGLLVVPLWSLSPVLAGAVGLSAAVMLALAVLRSPLPRQVLEMLARPMIQAGLLTVAGAGLLTFGLYRIDAELQESLAESDTLFASLTREVDFPPSPTLTVQTDQGNPIELWMPTSQSMEDLLSFSELDYLRRMRLEASLIQTGPADGEYNCHGWVFTGGRYWVRGKSVEAILHDNGYRETNKPMIGDLCIYRDPHGEVSHSAIVRGLGDKGLVLLESKWGKLGRYIHMAHEHHAYSGHVPTFYRSPRTGHLLHGLPVEQAVSNDLNLDTHTEE